MICNYSSINVNIIWVIHRLDVQHQSLSSYIFNFKGISLAIRKKTTLSPNVRVKRQPKKMQRIETHKLLSFPRSCRVLSLEDVLIHTLPPTQDMQEYAWIVVEALVLLPSLIISDWLQFQKSYRHMAVGNVHSFQNSVGKWQPPQHLIILY